jgi:hypothetical protein
MRLKLIILYKIFDCYASCQIYSPYKDPLTPVINLNLNRNH